MRSKRDLVYSQGLLLTAGKTRCCGGGRMTKNMLLLLSERQRLGICVCPCDQCSSNVTSAHLLCLFFFFFFGVCLCVCTHEPVRVVSVCRH